MEICEDVLAGESQNLNVLTWLNNVFFFNNNKNWQKKAKYKWKNTSGHSKLFFEFANFWID